jgi:N-ethylmaleimide reductase
MAYVHVMKANAFAEALNNAGDADKVLATMRAHVKGPMIAAGGYTEETAEQALEAKLLQAVVFGRPFIANPDLVARLKAGIALAEPKADLFYTPGPEGYVDYPAVV